MIGKEIRTILLSDATVSGLVSTRVYSNLAPQNDDTLPAVVYRIEAYTKQHTQDRAAVDDYRIEFDLYAETYGGLQELEDAVDSALDRYSIGAIVGDYYIDGISQEDSEDNPYDVDFDGFRHKSARYRVRIKEFALNYSLTEQETGLTWIDGSPVYQITIDESVAGQVDVIDSNYTIIDFWHTYGGADNDVVSPSGAILRDWWVKAPSNFDYWISQNGVNASKDGFYTLRYVKKILT